MAKKAPEFNYLFPPEECEYVYRVFGGKPSLDPCGHPEQFLEAERVLYGDPAAPDDNGMALSWAGETVFLNPSKGERLDPSLPGPGFQWYPFSKWIMKAVVESQKGANILLFAPSTTDTTWFHTQVVTAQSICFLNKRVKSYRPDTDTGNPVLGIQPKEGHLLALWTADEEVFRRFGEVYEDRGLIVDPNPLG